MKILEVLTYYRPHVSGLTIYVERLAKALSRQNHQVSVFTSQYDPSLPLKETKNGVRIIRVPVAFRVSKGVIMPKFGPMAWRMVREADVVHLHLPQFDAPGVAFRGRLLGKPVVLTYHSDLRLPPGLFNRVADQVVHGMNRIAGRLADAIVTYTYDFGSHSPFLSRYMDHKLHVISPPVELELADEEAVQRFQTRHGLEGKRIIGISARIAVEKGIEVLLRALPAVLDVHPNAMVIHANPSALGEEAYLARLQPLFDQNEANYKLLGGLSGPELSAFYKSLDCLVMCSLNNTETFGLVQVEAMMSGTPVVASNLPGVRQPVSMTGMGEVTPVGDHEALAAAINRILANPQAYQRPAERIAESFNPDATASAYLRLFGELQQGIAASTTEEPVEHSRLREMNEQFSAMDQGR
ncbi:MAG: glycosyltransferase family 4 protein [Candidatus Promineifilaceae bacterium]